MNKLKWTLLILGLASLSPLSIYAEVAPSQTDKTCQADLSLKRLSSPSMLSAAQRREILRLAYADPDIADPRRLEVPSDFEIRLSLGHEFKLGEQIFVQIRRELRRVTQFDPHVQANPFGLIPAFARIAPGETPKLIIERRVRMGRDYKKANEQGMAMLQTFGGSYDQIVKASFNFLRQAGQNEPLLNTILAEIEDPESGFRLYSKEQIGPDLWIGRTIGHLHLYTRGAPTIGLYRNVYAVGLTLFVSPGQVHVVPDTSADLRDLERLYTDQLSAISASVHDPRGLLKPGQSTHVASIEDRSDHLVEMVSHYTPADYRVNFATVQSKAHQDGVDPENEMAGWIADLIPGRTLYYFSSFYHSSLGLTLPASPQIARPTDVISQ